LLMLLGLEPTSVLHRPGSFCYDPIGRRVITSKEKVRLKGGGGGRQRVQPPIKGGRTHRRGRWVGGSDIWVIGDRGTAGFVSKTPTAVFRHWESFRRHWGYRKLVGGPSGAALPVGSTRKGSLPPVVAPAIGARRRYSRGPSEPSGCSMQSRSKPRKSLM
jgi:hypothetical protein